jgi:hypothetical protein
MILLLLPSQRFNCSTSSKPISVRFNAKNLGKIEKILGARVMHDRRIEYCILIRSKISRPYLINLGLEPETYKSKQISTTDYKSLFSADE